MAFHLGCKSGAVAKKQTPPTMHAPVLWPPSASVLCEELYTLGNHGGRCHLFCFQRGEWITPACLTESPKLSFYTHFNFYKVVELSVDDFYHFLYVMFQLKSV